MRYVLALLACIVMMAGSACTDPKSDNDKSKTSPATTQPKDPPPKTDS